MSKRPWDGVVTERDRQVYELGGFGKRGDMGAQPAIGIIDVMYHSVGDKPEPITESVKKYPASCGEEGWRAVGNIQRLLESARQVGVPIIYIVPVEHTDNSDYGRYVDKMPGIVKQMQVGSHRSTDIVEQIAPRTGDRIVRKPKSSGFFKTDLKQVLDELGTDTLLITGCTTSGCVRLTAADAFQHDLKAVVIEDCVYDRGQASHAINLWDMNAKYADVVPLDDVLKYFDRIGAAAGTGPGTSRSLHAV